METVLADRNDGVLTLTLNRPEVFNAYNLTLARELLGAFEAATNDELVRAIVLTGAGRAFCAGLDLKRLDEIVPAGETPRLGDFLRQTLNPLTEAIAACPKPVIAAINGVAAGAGMSLALACDLRIAAASASLVSAFVKVGLAPDAGLTHFLPRLVGPAEALRIAWTGDPIPAGEAERLGLVNLVVGDGGALDASQTLAARLAQGPAPAIAATKRILANPARTLAEALSAEAEEQQALGAGADFQEGVAAFLEKRPPRFR